MGLISKAKYHRILSDYFRKVGYFLEDGFYIVENNNIIKTKKTIKNIHKVFKVKTSKKIEEPYNGGRLFITQYKYGLLTEKKAYYFVRDKERYDLFKTNYLRYKEKLLYPAIELEFYDQDKIVITSIVDGTIYKDLSHFDTFLNILFDYSNKADAIEVKTSIFGCEYVLPWYVQHGDCKNGNIIWKNNNSFMMIDLEAIDLYPPLYDVFYYLFITKKEDSISILKSKEFNDKVKTFYLKRTKDVPSNILDITLANYAYFTSSKLKQGSELYEFEFYLYWRLYDSFDDFPITKRVLMEYEDKLRRYRMK